MFCRKCLKCGWPSMRVLQIKVRRLSCSGVHWNFWRICNVIRLGSVVCNWYQHCSYLEKKERKCLKSLQSLFCIFHPAVVFFFHARFKRWTLHVPNLIISFGTCKVRCMNQLGTALLYLGRLCRSIRLSLSNRTAKDWLHIVRSLSAKYRPDRYRRDKSVKFGTELP